MVKAITIFFCVLSTSLLAKDYSKEIDTIIAKDLISKKVEMPMVASSFVFVRRAYLDIVGRIPTYKETISFLKKPDRAKLIEDLQNSQGYTENMFNFYADLLRIKRKIFVMDIVLIFYKK